MRAGAERIGIVTAGTKNFEWNNKMLMINDAANGKMTQGATFNQGAYDNEILTLKSSDMSFAMTNETEADTYATFKKMHPTEGGLRVQGFTEQYCALKLSGCATLTHTTKATSSKGAVSVIARGRCGGGTGMGPLASNGNMFIIRQECTTRFIFDLEGSGHADVEFTTYDDHCDIELLRGVHGALVPCYTKEFGKDMMYNLCKYEDLGLVGKDSVHWEDRCDGRHQLRGMVNFTQLSMLHHSTIIQMADRFSTRLDSLETQLKAIQGGCP